MSVSDPSKILDKRQPELVNREQDLTLLLGLLPPRRSGSSFIVLKAPSGFGKTRLTTKVIELLQAEGVFVVALEPQVRAKNIASSVYQGFYIQRCAEALDYAVKLPANNALAPDFEAFLKTERVRRTKAVDVKGALRRLPGLKTAYGVGVELLDRLLNTGDHSSKKLLTSDSREAVETCSRYIRHVAKAVRVVLVVREAQHIDQASLNLLAEVADSGSPHSVILEYTLDASGDLNQLFSDLVETAYLQDADWLHIVELLRLTKPHLEQLLRLTVPGAGDINGEYYLKWDGNVRLIRQLRFSISVEHRRSEPLQLQNLKDGVVRQYQHQIQQLTPTDRFTLCLLLVHGEAMPKALAGLLLEKLNALATKGVVDQIVAGLVTTELVAVHTGDLLGLENEDVAEAVRTYPPLGGNLMLARGALRDYYRVIVTNAATHPTDVSFAVRQTLRLSVELGDMTTVEELVAHLSNGVTASVDQSWYVAQIVTAIGENARLFADQQDRLLLWAAELAYEISDFRKARDLLRQMFSKSAFSEALLCACCTETGDHEEALAMAGQLMMGSDANERFAGQLVELILLRCIGKVGEARQLWDKLEAQSGVSELKLYGYLLRFKELVADFPDCLDALRASSEWFIAHGLPSSAAYSELTLASHIARQGEGIAATVAVSRAKDLLASAARDQHILLNNEVAVNLLADDPDPAVCCDKLIRAIPCSGDDYSDLVLYTNLAVAAALADRQELAMESVGRALRIAGSPRFADRDVFWGVSFNLRFVDARLGLHYDPKLNQLFGILRPHSLQNDYWQHRNSSASPVPERFRHMLTKPYHPMFLSHWTIDVDGLRALNSVPSPALPGTSSLNS